MKISEVGDYARKIKKKNYDNVKVFFKENPDASIKDCERFLKLSYVTVHNHVKKLREEYGVDK